MCSGITDEYGKLQDNEEEGVEATSWVIEGTLADDVDELEVALFNALSILLYTCTYITNEQPT